ncbi:membrane protein of unknown function [Thermococcus camini]|uniref:Uncharacterized protein n=2 Tax=Thermococcus camini TaxID=2016373 RepID=A0A7G2DAW1_9EURY|nr:membrane protein of unknown function [Thermococcus camini]
MNPEFGLLVDGLEALSSILPGIFVLLRERIHRREKSLRSTLMFHGTAFEQYANVNMKIEREFEGDVFKILLVILLIITSLVAWRLGFKLRDAVIFGILVSPIIAPIIASVESFLVHRRILGDRQRKTEKDAKTIIGRAFLNVSLPVLVLAFFLFIPLLYSSASFHCGDYTSFLYNASRLYSNNSTEPFLAFKDITTKGNSWILVQPVEESSVDNCTTNLFITLRSSCKFKVCNSSSRFSNNPGQNSTAVAIGSIVAYLLEVLTLIGISRISLISEGQWISTLNEDKIKRSVFGLLLTFALSGVLTILWVWSLPSSMNHLILIGAIGMVILAYIVSDVKSVAVRLLWKVKLPEFSDKLPHLLVKTKTGNIFFGQLYDPLDDKLLIIRNAKLVIHGGQDVTNTLGKIVSHEVPPNKQENSLSVPWDEIEVLQIVEEGLYMTSENNSKNKNNSDQKEVSEKSGKKPK